ncbi:614/534 cytochrome P450 [Coprinopsis cinerea okayama7|uniref:614/534 cytochrome P450 n=1 Tax=Coprinopsis cinerea (strain Okayama-7 / 130 / ATCC MYA-4618 / FGSC 9003) TaxID=240176 RepID=A8NKW4_COPC7|nr:614/534 cytochrome P450 [Coprinopsis cinerea okayama7\|eukprot:XP_001834561.2 614/534 cytochrome P450 [Coprinopsis cinerea okayama7\
MLSLVVLSASFLLLWAGRVVFNVWKLRKSVGSSPVDYLLLGYGCIPAIVFIPAWRYIAFGKSYQLRWKHKIFHELKTDVYPLISILSPAQNYTVQIADVNAAKEVTTYRSRFPKPMEFYRHLTFYGKNIVAAEGDDWKKYRKVCAPAFNDRNNKLVWEAAIRIMDDLFRDVWEHKDEVEVPHIVDTTVLIALFVIGEAGFGEKLTWKNDVVAPPGFKYTVKEALHVVSRHLIYKVILPNWAYKLSKSLADIDLAFKEMGMYMQEMIRERSTGEKSSGRHDLMTALVENNVTLPADDPNRLTDQELMGNVFIFMLAGHETAAHTLGFAFAFLALYPEEQKKLYDHIKSVIPEGHTPTYEDMPKLTRCLAFINETLRHFPPIIELPKKAQEDTVLHTTNHYGEKVSVPIPKGGCISVNIPATHHNPKYWDDCDSFNPDRFLGEWPREAFLSYSAGPRSCLGRKFFETEAIAVLTSTLLQYEVFLKEEPQFAHETFEQRKARILNVKCEVADPDI